MEEAPTMADPQETRDARGLGVVDFGVLAVRNGLLADEQLDQCRVKQQASANLGHNLTLRQIVLNEKLDVPRGTSAALKRRTSSSRATTRARRTSSSRAMRSSPRLVKAAWAAFFKARQLQ